MRFERRDRIKKLRNGNKPNIRKYDQAVESRLFGRLRHGVCEQKKIKIIEKQLLISLSIKPLLPIVLHKYAQDKYKLTTLISHNLTAIIQ